MFGEEDNYDEGAGGYPSELLAVGQYVSDPEEILRGFKIFQKKYVYKSTALYLVLVVLAIASQVMSLIYDSRDPMFSAGLIVLCLCVGSWIALRPHNTLKNLSKSLEGLKGSVYEAEISTDKIKISTIYDAPVENAPPDDEPEETAEDDPEKDVIPATIVHLDNSAVEIVECDDMFILYVKKVNIFVMPKSAFKEEECTLIRDKLSNLMGVRYKAGE